MHKITKELGYEYSRGSFEYYKFRAKVLLLTDDNEEHAVDIYTTNPSRESLEMFIRSKASEKVTEVKIIHWTTREQDEKTAELIKDWIDEDDKKETEQLVEDWRKTQKKIQKIIK